MTRNEQAAEHMQARARIDAIKAMVWIDVQASLGPVGLAMARKLQNETRITSRLAMRALGLTDDDQTRI